MFLSYFLEKSTISRFQDFQDFKILKNLEVNDSTSATYDRIFWDRVLEIDERSHKFNIDVYENNQYCRSTYRLCCIFSWSLQIYYLHNNCQIIRLRLPYSTFLYMYFVYKITINNSVINTYIWRKLVYKTNIA